MSEAVCNSCDRGRQRISIRAGRGRIPIDVVSFDNVLGWATARERAHWEILVTPNLYHLRLVRDTPHLAELYAHASLSIPDGWPVAWIASRIARKRINRVVGADVFDALTRYHCDGTPLVLIGGTSGPQLDALGDRCRKNGWNITVEPAPRAELTDSALREQLLQRVCEAGTGGVVVIGIGAPLQEELAADISSQVGHGAIMCLGMSINFSSGVVRRAPIVFRALRLEWLYRALSEPRRLLSRYAMDLMALPRLVWQNSD